MKSTFGILIGLCVLLSFVSHANSQGLATSLKCFHEKDYRFFDLKPLMTGEDDPIYSLEYKNSTGFESRIYFDFCESLEDEYQCGGADALASQQDTAAPFNESCVNLSQKPGKGESVKLVETDNQDNEHLLLSYSTDTPCTGKNGTNWGIKFEIYCDKNVTDSPVYTRNEANSDDCVQYIDVRHKSGCKVGDLNGLWRFVEDNAWIFCIIFMVIGAFYIVFGLKLLRPTLFIIGTLSTMVVILFLFYVLILPNNVDEWAGWVILSCSAILGLIVGFFAAKLVRIGAFILGAWAGAGIGLLLSNMAFYKIDSVAVLWVMIVLLGLVLGLLSFVFFNGIVIFSTSVLGAYLLMRGLSLVAGGYPNEFTVYERIKDGEIDNVPGTFYVYMAGVLILAIAGIFLQFKMFRKAKENDSKQYDYYNKV